MTKQQLFELIKKKESFLCIGLDSDITKIPKHLLAFDDPIFEFNKQIIDATIDKAVAYKPNLAFYEANGIKGLISLEKTMKYLDKYKKTIFTIADAKRGDIGNTSAMYAKMFFDQESSSFDFDAVTVAPYMGEDSVKPFLTYKDKWVVLLALTSNKGADDFQMLNTGGKHLFENVLLTSSQWGSSENMMYVVGATRAEMLTEIRKIVPEHFLLIPGVGAQGGSLDDVVEYGINSNVGLLVNSSRAIIYASNSEDFAEKAALEAKIVQQQMKVLLQRNGILK